MSSHLRILIFGGRGAGAVAIASFLVPGGTAPSAFLQASDFVLVA